MNKTGYVTLIRFMAVEYMHFSKEKFNMTFLAA
jgi:hypothetical protein